MNYVTEGTNVSVLKLLSTTTLNPIKKDVHDGYKNYKSGNYNDAIKKFNDAKEKLYNLKKKVHDIPENKDKITGAFAASALGTAANPCDTVYNTIMPLSLNFKNDPFRTRDFKEIKDDDMTKEVNKTNNVLKAEMIRGIVRCIRDINVLIDECKSSKSKTESTLFESIFNIL